MSIIDNIQQSFQALIGRRKDADSVKSRVDAMLSAGVLDEYIEEKAYDKYKTTKSQLDIRKYQEYTSAFYNYLFKTVKDNELPTHGHPSRDIVLSQFWMEEPILSGAVYSMAAKMSSLSWAVVGKKTKAVPFSEILWSAGSSSGYDWSSFISPTAQDFYTTDRGVFWETPRENGRIVELGHIDALQCAPTGIFNKPVYYLSSITGQEIWFKPEDIIRFSSMPSPRESMFGNGFCAVARAYKSAKLLLGLHQYDVEKLNNLPPEGVAAVSGLTMDEFKDALAFWKAAREKNQSLTFPQVLWLLGSQIGSQVKVDITGFSQMPESFSREIVVNQYVNIVALDFGVDVREFWPISSGALGSASESEIQHMKAKGKGPGEFISTVERKLNDEFAETDEAEFQFDTQDMGEDQTSATIAKTWIDAFMPLYTGAPSQKGGKPGGQKKAFVGEGEEPATPSEESPQMSGLGTGAPAPQAEQVIDKQQFLRLLVDRRVLPNWMVEDERVAIYDSGVSEKQYESARTLYRLNGELKEYSSGEDVVKVVWKQGVLTQTRLEPYQIINPSPKSDNVPYADLLGYLRAKESAILEPVRNIRGKPIPADEALRGNLPTKQAILNELERWRKNPILAAALPAVFNEKSILATLESKA